MRRLQPQWQLPSERGQRKQDVLAPAAGRKKRAGSGCRPTAPPIGWRPPAPGARKPIVSTEFPCTATGARLLDAVVGSASALQTLGGSFSLATLKRHKYPRAVPGRALTSALT